MILQRNIKQREEGILLLIDTITEENKDNLKILHFPNIKITFDDLFEEIESI